MQLLGSGTILYSLTMLFVKMALFLLYYRVFAVQRRTKVAIYLGMIIICLFYLQSVIYTMVLCIPRRKESWVSPHFISRCYQSEVMADVQGAFGLVSDLYIYILPLPILLRLQMSVKKKLGVTAIFLTGLM